MITILIVILSVLTSVAAFRREELFYKLDLSPARIVHQKEYYRIFTHAFLHADYFHLGINMLVLYSFGRYVEQIFSQLESAGLIFSGPFFYILLYVIGIVLASVSTIFRNRNNESYSAVGASGAVSAIVFSYIFFAPLEKIYFYMVLPIPGILFGVLYLIYSSYMSRRKSDNINHSAHFWGAVVGFVFPILLEPSLFMVFLDKLFP
ncbi:MAG: rhomboid family intramembrane serine protease [Bacteroidetes bacterium]|nr:MAG: rhomboid family intramembrane serine protease [Bacteroidota bacterium]